MSNFGVGGQIIFPLNVSKNYFSPVYGRNFGQNCQMSKFVENRQIIFSLKVFKNYFSQVDLKKFGKKFH